MAQVPGQFIKLKPKFEHNKKGEGAILVSNFLVTLNTNARMTAEDKDLEAESIPLYNMAEVVFGDGEKLAHIVDFGRRGPRGVGGKFTFINDESINWNLDTVVDYRVTVGVEIGHNARGKRLHAHVVVKIRHKSFIRLDKDEILKRVNSYLETVGYKYPIKHINIRVTPPSAEDYLNK